MLPICLTVWLFHVVTLVNQVSSHILRTPVFSLEQLNIACKQLVACCWIRLLLLLVQSGDHITHKNFVLNFAAFWCMLQYITIRPWTLIKLIECNGPLLGCTRFPAHLANFVLICNDRCTLTIHSPPCHFSGLGVSVLDVRFIHNVQCVSSHKCCATIDQTVFFQFCY